MVAAVLWTAFPPLVGCQVFANVWACAGPLQTSALAGMRPFTSDPSAVWTAPRWVGLLLLLVVGSSQAFERTLYFQSLEPRVQLAQNTVSAVLTDSLGFLWIATQAGLHRYDGFNLELIQHDPDQPGSLADNLVTALAEDDRQQLWVGTNNAYLAVIDLRTGKLRNLPRRADLRANQVSALYFAPGGGPDGGLWIGTGRGIEQLVPGQERGRSVAGADSQLVFDFVQWHGALYVASASGLHRLLPGVAAVEALSVDAALSLAVSPDGQHLFVGQQDGLYELTSTGLVRRWPTLPEAHPVPALSFDPGGSLWLGVPGRGLVRFVPADGSHAWFRRRAGVPGTLPEDRLKVVHVDPSGLLWVGGETTGISHAPSEGSRFTLVKDIERERPSSNNIRTFQEAADGSLWIGTEGDGLKRYLRDTGQFQYYDEEFAQALQLPAVPEDLRVLALLLDEHQRLWIGSNHGLFSRAQDGRLQRHQEAGRSAESDRLRHTIRSLVLDDHGHLWLALSGQGVLQLDRDSGQVLRQYRHNPADPHSLAHDFVLKAYKDLHGHLWFGTLQGLSLHEPQADRWSRFRFDVADPHSLPGDLVRVLHEDARQRLWVGTHSGLAQIIESEGRIRFHRIDVRPALPSATVYGILSDAGHNLWLSSNSGLARLDAQTQQVFSFGLVEGLQGLEFNGDAALALRDGQLLFGGLAGINLVRPLEFTPSTRQVPVRLTAFASGRARQMQRFVEDLRTLELAHDERVLSFQFAALDFRDPQRNQHAYRLEGFDEGWVEGSGLAQATYTNLNPGHYVFRARGSNRDGVFNPDELAVDLIILPPWWSSRPARGIYAGLLSLVLAISLLERQRRRVQRREHLAELREREERLSVCLWGSGDDFWDWDISRGVLYRHGTEQLLGSDQDGSLSELEWMRQVVHPDDLPLVRRRMEVALSGAQPFYESEHRIRGGGSDWVWVLARGKVVDRDSAARPLRMAGTARNITHLRSTQQELKIAAEVIGNMSEAVSVLDLQLCFVSVNPAFQRVTGYSADEAMGQSLQMLDSPRHSDAEYQTIRSQILDTGRWHGELWLRRKDASDLCAALEIVRIRRGGEADLIVVVMNDITERKRAELELKYLANFDALTGLPNRTMFHGRLLHAVKRANRRNARLALLFIDLDRFKQINDTLGHAAGDELLRATSQRMTATVPGGAIVARLGGDEFTVLLPDLRADEDAQKVAQALIDAFVDPVNLGGNEVVISPSIGIACYPEHGDDPGTLLKHADAAMYSSKDAGRNTWRVYNDELAHLTRQRVALEAGLRRAMERREFQLVFQPILRLADRRIITLETLLRWHHPEFGTIAPDVFVPILEESGMVVTVGSWVLSEALAQLKHWRAQGFTELRLAVNISTLQLLRGELHDQIAELLRHFDLPGSCLELELTETLVMSNPEQSIRSLDMLAAQGVAIAVDDFGTGYSSLSYLKRLPIKKLKIDKSFIRDIGRDPDDTTIVNIIIALAHVLELSAVAEGVETEEQLHFLESSGCDQIQGYLLCKPLPAAEVQRYLQDASEGRLPQALLLPD